MGGLSRQAAFRIRARDRKAHALHHAASEHKKRKGQGIRQPLAGPIRRIAGQVRRRRMWSISNVLGEIELRVAE